MRLSGRKTRRPTRPWNSGAGLFALLLVLTACTAAHTPVRRERASPLPRPPAATATAAPSASATVPADSDETAPPQSGDKVISSTIALDWSWPGPGRPFKATHENPVPISPPPAAPLPTLYAIGSGEHPAETPPYDQLSFRFQGGFPSYDIEFVPELIADGSGLPVPMPGTGAILRVVFRGAQAHTADGTASTITSAPAPSIGYQALTSYAPAGDFEGVRELRDRRRPADGTGAGDEGARVRGREDRAAASTCTSSRSSWTPPPGSSCPKEQRRVNAAEPRTMRPRLCCVPVSVTFGGVPGLAQALALMAAARTWRPSSSSSSLMTSGGSSRMTLP